MSTIRRFVLLLLVATIATACAASKSDEPVTCDPNHPHTHRLKFKLKADGCVDKVLKGDGTDGEEISVCRGDTVEWQVRSLKKKSVAFDKGDGSPAPGPTRTSKAGKSRAKSGPTPRRSHMGTRSGRKGPRGSAPSIL
jgi:hypothetical protein